MVVVIAGVLAQGPLSRVPENTIKFVVGLLLTSFGCFWAAEGAGVDWPGDELSLLGVIAFFRRSFARARGRIAAPADRADRSGGRDVRYLRAFGRFWWN